MGLPSGRETLDPRDFRREIARAEHLPVGAIEHVEDAVTIAVKQQLPRLAFPHLIGEHHWLHRVPVVRIVRA